MRPRADPILQRASAVPATKRVTDRLGPPEQPSEHQCRANQPLSRDGYTVLRSLAGERLDCGGLGSRDLAEQFGLAGICLQFLEGQLELIEQAPSTLGARARKSTTIYAARTSMFRMRKAVPGREHQSSLNRCRLRSLNCITARGKLQATTKGLAHER